MKIKIIILSTLYLVLSGCTTGELVRSSIKEGMTKAEVIKVLGRPDGFKKTGSITELTYKNVMISGWSWDRTDYTIVLDNDKVVQYGSGVVRERGPNTHVVIPIN